MHTIVFTILIHVIHKNGSLESIMLQSIYGHICKLHIKKNICRIAVEIVFLFFQENYICQSSKDQKNGRHSHNTSKLFFFLINKRFTSQIHNYGKCSCPIACIYKPETETHGWIVKWVAILGDLWLRSSQPAWAWVEWPARYPDYTVWPGFPPLRVESEHGSAFADQ